MLGKRTEIHMYKMFVLAITLVCLSASESSAVSEAVKRACRDDYFAFCSAHEVGSEALRSCMRSHRKQLSKRCAVTLAKAGEASKADIERYKREAR
jgi:hypothetical protein